MQDMKITQIISATAVFNRHGILLTITNKTTIISISVMYNSLEGISLLTSNNCNITALAASFNGGIGLSVSLSHNTNIIAARVWIIMIQQYFQNIYL